MSGCTTDVSLGSIEGESRAVVEEVKFAVEARKDSLQKSGRGESRTKNRIMYGHRLRDQGTVTPVRVSVGLVTRCCKRSGTFGRVHVRRVDCEFRGRKFLGKMVDISK